MTELNFATSDAEAAERAARFLASDPFPSVPLSLLSAAEIDDYARLTGLLYPFDSRSLKSASYEVHVGGEFIRWNEEGRRVDEVLTRGSRCILPANSLCFIQLEPYFRVPYYIALRLSLQTMHIHRGLLLGTGPLVDPGFSGRVLIPVHNLTATDYDLDTTRALVWVEFTKTTFGFRPAETEASAKRYFPGFPPAKLNLSADAYLRKANSGNPISTLIPAAVAEAQSSAQKAASWTRNLAIGALAGIVITVLGLATALYGYFDALHTLVQNAQINSEAVNSRIETLAKDIGQLDRQLLESASAMERRVGDDMNRRLDVIKGEMEQRFGLVETDYRTTVSAMKNRTENQENRLGVLEAEIKGVREKVDKKR
jgi:deoxycytidine triphosphate deaminase